MPRISNIQETVTLVLEPENKGVIMEYMHGKALVSRRQNPSGKTTAIIISTPDDKILHAYFGDERYSLISKTVEGPRSGSYQGSVSEHRYILANAGLGSS